MKTLISFILILMCSVLTASAQDGTSVSDFSSFFATFATLVAAIPICVEVIKKLIGKTSATKNLYVQIISWVTGIALTMIGWFLNLGFLADLSWIYALVYGLGASLAANGIADTKIIQSIISLFIKK